METFEHVVQVPYKQILNNDFQLKGNWAKDFFKNNKPIILELGCGKGEYTVNMAKAFPDKNFIGIDIKGNRMYIGAKQALEKEVRNVAFLRTRIEQICDYFRPQSKNETLEGHVFHYS